MCFDLDSAPPIPPLSGAAVSHDDLVLEARDGNRSQHFWQRPRRPRVPASSSSRTSAASTASTRSSPCASPSAGMPRSRSTTSGGLPAQRSVTTTSSTCRTCSRRRQPGCRRTWPLALRTSARPDATRSSRSGSASEAATRGLRPQLSHGLAGAIGFYGRPGAGQRRHTGTLAARRRDECTDPRTTSRRRSRDSRRGLRGFR